MRTGVSSTESTGEVATDRPLAPVYSNVLEAIGNTPMFELARLDTGPCRLFAKAELNNPAGSIKDRIGLSMIEGAEREGILDPKSEHPPTIIEATAGNTGLGLALVAGQRGYKLIVVVPDKMSQEKIQHLRAMGAEVILARSDVTKGDPEYYQEKASALAKQTPNSFFVNQFSNEHNIRAHHDTTGPEIWAQMEGKVDAIVVGVGSGGTLTGLGRYLREKNPDVKIILADPEGSVLTPLVNEGKTIEPGSWLVEGMGEDFVPDICDLDLVTEAIWVSDKESFLCARELLTKEGILAGTSTGCLVAAAMRWCQKQTEPLRVVTLLCDQGAKYLSKAFNDFWMIDNGFIEREQENNLRDLIGRRHLKREDITLDEDETLLGAIKRMQMYDISQMVVMDHKARVTGIIDESDILMAVSQDQSAFTKEVTEVMTTRIETITPDHAVEDLMPIFRADRVAIVQDEDGAYYGLITKIDLINYLRRQLPR